MTNPSTEPGTFVLDPQETMERLGERLLRHRGKDLPEVYAKGFRPSAVLVCIYPGKDNLTVLMTLRTDTLAHHKGQISFPGGGLEPGESLLECALRETEEELSFRVPPERVSCSLDETPVISNYRIKPFVALLDERPVISPNSEEVAEVLEFPLADFLDPTKHRLEVHEFQGMEVPIHFYEAEGKIVWGASARILTDLLYVAFDYRPPRYEDYLHSRRDHPRRVP